MEIRASSVYDWQTVKEFNKFHNSKKNKFKRVSKVLFPISAVLIAICFISAILLDFIDKQLIIIMAIYVAIAGFVIFAENILPKILFNKNAMVKNTVNTFVFGEEEFSHKSENAVYNDNATIKYSGLHNAYETESFIYLYITARQAFIVDKTKIEDGKEIELTKLLINKLGEKYKMVS